MLHTVGSKKFLDLGAFPLDPEDIAGLRARARPDEMHIYLRLFNEAGFIRTVVIASTIDNLKEAWDVSNHWEPMNDVLALRLFDKVYQTFSRPDVSPIDQGISTAAMKALCLYYMPPLRKLRKVPKENIIGVIFEYSDGQLKEYCYTQFTLDELTLPLH